MACEKMNKNLSLAKELARKLELPMKILSAQEEGGDLTFHFSSETKVDLRDLVKKLQEKTKKKIIMHQVSAREEIKFLASVGPCGRKLCCLSFLKTLPTLPFDNQTGGRETSEKTGLCGKPLCCLSFEEKKITAKEEPPQESKVEKTVEIPQKAEEPATPPSRRVLRILPRRKPRHRR